MKLHPWFITAKKEALKSSYKHRIGAVVVSGGSCLSRGFNELRHARDLKEYSAWENSVHAERNAIKRVKDKSKLQGASIFIYREFKNGMPATAAPCNNCLDLIKAVGIKKVYFTMSTFPYYGEIKL